METNWKAKFLLGICVAIAIGALAISGSVSQGILGLSETGFRAGPESSWFNDFFSAFLRDITGTPGFGVAAIKFLSAISVASGVVWFLPKPQGKVTFKWGDLELSGKQTKIVLWCIVFVVVKWA